MNKEIKDGPFESHYLNGQLESEGTFKDGKPNGPFKVYHQNGQLKEKGTYKDGKLDGLIKFYNENGLIRLETSWKDGEFHGPTRTYHLNGQLESEQIFKDGKMIDSKSYNMETENMEYSFINSWKDFSENFDQIKKDLIENIGNGKKRINCINVLLESEPQGDYFGRDEEDIFDKLNKYYFKYQQIMKTYLINNMVMLDDIMKTEHFSSLSQSKRDLFIEFHKNLGNQVIKNMELY